MRKRVSVMFLAAGMVAAQQPAQQPPPAPTFRAETQLVPVSVVAQDKEGKPVADLRREEFQIFDNGASQELRVFVAETDKSRFVAEGSSSTRPRTFTNQIPSPAGSHNGYSVILIDNLFTDFGDPEKGQGSANARVKTLRMLRSIPIGEKIAIYAQGRKLQIICEFTSDRDLLERQLGLWRPQVDTPDTSNDIFSNTKHIGDATAVAVSEASRIDARQRMSSNNDEMDLVADHLAGIPGRKNLIWLSNNRFMIGPRALRRLSDAGVAIYPVDIEGVCGFCLYRSREVANGIAALTGGVSYYMRNDIDVVTREAMDDGRVSYTLGFYAAGNDGAPRVHQLTVRTTRPGVTLRYRTSYLTEPPKPASANPVADLLQAMNRPVDATSIPIAATATRGQGRLNLLLSLGVSSLGLELSQGLWKGQAELVARFMTADGTPAGETISETLSFNLRPETYAAMLQSGVSRRKEIEIPAKAVELKVLFGNLASGRIGTLTIPLSEVGSDEVKK